MERIDTLAEETAVIGAICQEPKLIRSIARNIEPRHFSSEACRSVYQYALDEDADGRKFDPLIAASALKDAIPEIRCFLAECMDMTPTTANAEEYAKLLLEKSNERELREGIAEALETEHGEKLTETIAALCAEQIKGRPQTRMKQLQTAMERTYKGLFEPMENRVDTGYGRLDRIVKGMWGGQLIIVAARPAVGKSAFALSLAENAARKGKVVQFYSLEMEDHEICERELARWVSKLTMNDLIDRDFASDEDKCADLANSYIKTSALPIYLDDSCNVKPSKVRAQALTQDDLGMIVVDYGGLMSSDREYDSRNLELGAISRDLKNLAKELNIPIVMLAQLNRRVADDTKPTLTELRDSGELEQNATKCIFLWNVDKENGKVGVSVAKNRRGKLGDVVMHFDGDHMRFTETEERYEEPRRRGKIGGNGFSED